MFILRHIEGVYTEPVEVCPRKESNPHHLVRSEILYPLSYGGKAEFILARKF
jgi:hypothetical protein